MTKRRTRRYNLPRIDLNEVKIPKIDLPKVDRKTARFKFPKINLPWKQIGILAGIVALALIMLNLNTRLSEYARLKGENSALSTQVGGLRATKAALETEVAYVESDAAVIDGARQSHMIRDGEQLIIVLTPSGDTVATPEASVEEYAAPEPWEVWMALFFGQ